MDDAERIARTLAKAKAAREAGEQYNPLSGIAERHIPKDEPPPRPGPPRVEQVFIETPRPQLNPVDKSDKGRAWLRRNFDKQLSFMNAALIKDVHLGYFPSRKEAEAAQRKYYLARGQHREITKRATLLGYDIDPIEGMLYDSLAFHITQKPEGFVLTISKDEIGEISFNE